MGSIFIYGSIMIYVDSYFRLQGTSNPELLFLGIPLQATTMAIFLPLGVHLNHTISIRITVAIGLIFTLICFFCSSYVTGPLAFVVLFGGAHGIGNGLTFLAPVTAGWQYYPTRKGLISGLTICIFGFGAFLFTIISNRLINPENLSPDKSDNVGKVTYHYFGEDIANRFPPAIRLLCIIWAVLVLFAILLLRSPSYTRKLSIINRMRMGMSETDRNLTESLVNRSSKDQSYRAKLYELVSPEADEHEFSLKEIASTREFWLLCLMSFFSIFLGFFMTSAYKTYGNMKIKDDEFLSIVGAVGFITNGSSRLILSTLLDFFSFKSVYGAVLIVQILLCCTYDLVAENKAAFLIYTCLSISFEGAHFAMFPTICGQIYGARSGTFAFSLVGSAFALSTLAGFVANKYLLPAVGFEVLFFMCAGFCAIAILILGFFFHPVPHAHQRYVKQQI